MSDTWSWSETFSKVTGNHSMKFGGEYRAMLNDQQNPTSSFGRFTFNRGFTQADPLRADAASGNSVASLLLGYPARRMTGASSRVWRQRPTHRTGCLSARPISCRFSAIATTWSAGCWAGGR